MIRRYLALFCVVLFAGSVTLLLYAFPSVLFPPAPIETAHAPLRKTATTRPAEPADLPAPKRLKDKLIDPYFLASHNAHVARARRGNIDLLFLGDSITQGWSTTGQAVWNQFYTSYRAANFGSGGDRTQHLLWRIDNGELDGVAPKVVVLLIGTNNTDYPAEDIIRADRKIVREIREILPQSKLLLLGIFPREYSPTDSVRLEIRQVNSELANLDDGSSIRYLDIGGKFLTPSGNLKIELMPDLLHPGAKGYEVWAEAMEPLLAEMMR